MYHKKTRIFFYVLIIVSLFTFTTFIYALDGFTDFEEGTDGSVIRSTIPGLEFTTTDSQNWIYGDWRTRNYNGPYPNGVYYSNGNFFAWLGPNQGTGRIDFTQGNATYLTVWTSTYSGLTMDAYDQDGNLLNSSGWASGNLYTGTMSPLTVHAPGMKYVLIHDTGNYWLIDDLYTDAPGVGEAYRVIQLDAVNNVDIKEYCDPNTYYDTFWIDDPFTSMPLAGDMSHGFHVKAYFNTNVAALECNYSFRDSDFTYFRGDSCRFDSQSPATVFNGTSCVFKVNLPRKIDQYTMVIHFNFYDSDNRLVETAVTSHTLYVTLDRPRENVYPPKEVWLNKAVSWAKGTNTEEIIYEKVQHGTYKGGTRSGGSWVYVSKNMVSAELWDDLLEGLTTDCDCKSLTHIWNNVCKILGLQFTTPVSRGATDYGYNDPYFLTKPVTVLDHKTGNAYTPGSPPDRWFYEGHVFGKGLVSGIGDKYYDPTFDELYGTDKNFLVEWEVTNNTPYTRDEKKCWDLDEGRHYILEMDAREKNDGWGEFEYHSPGEDASPVPPPGDAEFAGDYTATPIDNNGDGQFDALLVTAKVLIQEPGTLHVSGAITAGDVLITNRDNINNLHGGYISISGQTGLTTVQIPFSGEDIHQSNINGPYQVTLYITNSIGTILSDVNFPTSLLISSEFGELPVRPGSVSDSAIDTNADGMNDSLVIQVNVQAYIPGNYYLHGSLSGNATSIAAITKEVYLNPGTEVIELVFNGVDINKTGLSGPYDVNLELYDQSSSLIGRSLSFSTKYYDSLMFEQKSVLITGPFRDFGIDTDGNGLYNTLTLEAGINVTEAGNYIITGWLQNSNSEASRDISRAQTAVSATPGLRNVLINFNGADIYEQGIDGPYRIFYLTIEKEGTLDNTIIDSSRNVHTTNTYSYSSFDPSVPSLVWLTGKYSHRGIDVNGNEKYDYLGIGMEIAAAAAGYVIVDAVLQTGDGTFLGITADSIIVQANNPIKVELKFSGKDIYASGKNGPYILTSVRVRHLNDQRLPLPIDNVYTTGYYSANQFEPVPTGNQAPVANAGPDQTVEAVSAAETPVTLNGSGSYDPDGNPLSYAWTGPFGNASGVNPTVILSLGYHKITLTVSDGVLSAADDVYINVTDTTPPEIVITVPENEGVYLLNQEVQVSWTATDTVSGIANTTATTPDGGMLDCSSPGARSFTVTATDQAGNLAQETVTYHVCYAFSGFLSPLNDGSRVYNLGSTIPVKFRLTDAREALIINAKAGLYLIKIIDGVETGEVKAQCAGNSNEDNLFRWAGDLYIYNLKTKYLSKGTWRLKVVLDDGSVKEMDIGLE